MIFTPPSRGGEESEEETEDVISDIIEEQNKSMGSYELAPDGTKSSTIRAR
jgi:hypothetical protein